MKFDGEFVVDGSPAEVWPYFNDPEILQDCAPGCKELTLESPSEIRASLEVGVGSVKPSFEVSGVVVECDEPNRLELRASGEASRNSFDVTAWQELTDNGDGTTTVAWEADAEVSGVIASLGERALESVTNKLVNDFFQDIEDHVNAGTPAEAQFRAAGEEEIQAAEEATAAAREGDLIDDLLALLGSLRGGSEEGEGSDRTALSLSVGAAVGLVVALLWSRRRGSDAESDAASGGDTTEAADVADAESAAGDDPESDTGGAGRYLLAGVVIGVVGKVLWDAYSDGDTADEESVDPAGVTERDGADIGETAVERADSRTNGATASSDEQEGMIDNPLDRLN